VTKFVLM